MAVAVPCWNEARRLPPLLAALSTLRPAPGALLAVDDGSDDGTGALLAGAVGVAALAHPRNEGLAVARNTLWRAARDGGWPVVVYLDADVTPPADLLARIAALFAADEDCAGVGGRNVDPLAPVSTRADAWRARFWPQDLGPASLPDAPMLVGAVAAYRVEALEAVGGFDPRFRTNGEDVDVGRRLRAAGLRLRYAPDLVVTHRRLDTPTSLVRACYRHGRDGMRAACRTAALAPTPADLALGMAKKALWAPGAALVRRGDPLEAALGAAACGAGLLGYAVGWARP